MKRGAIVETARRDSRELVQGSLILLLICAGVLGFNWKYVYNWCVGPFPFDDPLSAAPGPREFVRTEGQLTSTGVVQETTVRLLHGLAETKNVSARYVAMKVGDRFLVAKVPADFSGQIVEGRLVPLPEVVKTALGSGTPAYPWLVDAQTSYRWDFNLFVMVAAPLFLIFLLLFLLSAWRATSVKNHPALAGLKRLGPPLQIAERIENELRMAGDNARAGPLWIGPSWFVALAPSLHVHPVGDIMGLAHHLEAKKSSPSHSVRLWLRGKMLPEQLEVSEGEARAALAGAAARLPGLVTDDGAGFDRRWKADRAACEREIDGKLGRRPAASRSG
jgi:hypothetical protein